MIECPNCGETYESTGEMGLTADGRSVCTECGYDGTSENAPRRTRVSTAEDTNNDERGD